MKKNWLSDSLDPGLLQKMSKVMRILFILIFGISMAVSAESYAQVTRMDVNMKNSTILDVIEYVENNSKFIFLYKNEDLDVDKKVNLKLNGATIDEVLEVIFEGEDVQYDIYDRQIVVRKATKTELSIPQGNREISGIVSDVDGEAIPGVTVMIPGTSIGTVTDIDGKFTLQIPESAETLHISFVGMKTQEISVVGKTNFTVILESDIAGIDEVVVVGYGTQKKTHLTASVSQVDSEVVENRPVSNVSQALQGAVPNLQISNTSFGGEPGADMDINIRGFMTSGGTGDIGGASPLILIDGVEMSMNDIDPEDIETVSVLKDAAAASIYGSRAAGGAILITTKSGKNMRGGMQINYSNNFSWAQPTILPESVDAYTFALVMNEARANINGNPWYTEEELEWIQMNMEEPGSAPSLVARSNGLSWDQSSAGLGATGATDWKDFLYKDWASRQKHNINFKGGDQELNYYISAGFYDEAGLLEVGDESYQRYNLDAKIASKPYKWLSFELLTKFVKSKDEFPISYSQGTYARQRGQVLDLMTKIKPTLPTHDPFGEPLVQAYYPRWQNERTENENNQIVLLPRVVIEPIKGWMVNLEYNYKRNNNRRMNTAVQTEYYLPNETIATTPSQAATEVAPTLFTNEYFSPNLYTSYTKSVGDHNFKVLAGYQSELYEVYNLYAEAKSLLSDNIPSISTAVGEQTVDDAISHWATQSYFGRFNYDYKGKYLLEVSYRRDGSSRFEDGSRWAGFPSVSAGYNVAKEDFWPLKDWVSNFKLRGSFGTLGNQNVSNYLYVPTMSVSQGTYLFNSEWLYTANAPDLTSVNLTWETVETMDFGFDASAFNDKLTVNFDWYRTDINDMAAQGEALPAVLGTSAPLTNIGVTRIQGWETEILWKQKVREFNYNVRFVLSDYKRTIEEYPNPTLLLSDYYAGKDLGEIWGLEWDGWFQSTEEVAGYEIDQSYIRGGTWKPGDTKYVDQNGDKVIDRGTNTLGDSGDFVVIGNQTPRYQYGLTLGCDWKGIDFSMFIQGVGKRDVLMSNHQRFRGPAQGPFHAMVFEEHMDYWRDETSLLGANTDAYFPRPYAQNPGNNNRNYRFPVDRYVQNGAYMRLKSLQIGYTLPKSLSQKVMLDRVRVYVSGENLWTKTDMMMYDPETSVGNFGSAYSYPLSKVISTGLNISF